jgi:hypothetical protein
MASASPARALLAPIAPLINAAAPAVTAVPKCFLMVVFSLILKIEITIQFTTAYFRSREITRSTDLWSGKQTESPVR